MGHLEHKRALSGPLAARKRPDTRPKSVVSMSPTHVQQRGGFWTKYGPFGPSEDLQDPQKGHFGPKRVLFGPLGTKKRPKTRLQYVTTIIPTQSDQSAAVGTNSGPRGPSKSLQDPQKGHFWSKWALSGVPGGLEEARYQAKVCGNHELSLGIAARGIWDQIWPLRALWVPPGPPKRGILGQNTPFLGPCGPRRGPIPGQGVVTITPTQLDQLVAIGTKSSPKSGPQSFSPS